MNQVKFHWNVTLSPFLLKKKRAGGYSQEYKMYLSVENQNEMHRGKNY